MYLTWIINGKILIVKLLEKYFKLVLGRERKKEIKK
jgi:hypothetical protein